MNFKCIFMNFSLVLQCFHANIVRRNRKSWFPKKEKTEIAHFGMSPPPSFTPPAYEKKKPAHHPNRFCIGRM